MIDLTKPVPPVSVELDATSSVMCETFLLHEHEEGARVVTVKKPLSLHYLAKLNVLLTNDEHDAMEQEMDRMTLFPEHVDRFIDDRKNDPYARFMLAFFRLPTERKMAFDKFYEGKKLFCTHKGERYRVTGASRGGDVWLVKAFTRDTGYDLRVFPTECSVWSAEP